MNLELCNIGLTSHLLFAFREYDFQTNLHSNHFNRVGQTSLAPGKSFHPRKSAVDYSRPLQKFVMEVAEK